MVQCDPFAKRSVANPGVSSESSEESIEHPVIGVFFM
jgi:hypothetical protein